MFPLKVLVMAALCACAHAVDFEDCGSEYIPKTFDLDTGCAETWCNITAGGSAKATITYTAKYMSSTLSQKMYLRLNRINYDQTVTPEPCATGSGQTCPVQDGSTYTYVADVTFGTDFYPVTGSLYWVLTNEEQKKVLCYRVNVSAYVPKSRFVEALRPEETDFHIKK